MSASRLLRRNLFLSAAHGSRLLSLAFVRCLPAFGVFRGAGFLSLELGSQFGFVAFKCRLANSVSNSRIPASSANKNAVLVCRVNETFCDQLPCGEYSTAPGDSVGEKQ